MAIKDKGNKFAMLCDMEKDMTFIGSQQDSYIMINFKNQSDQERVTSSKGRTLERNKSSINKTSTKSVAPRVEHKLNKVVMPRLSMNVVPIIGGNGYYKNALYSALSEAIQVEDVERIIT